MSRWAEDWAPYRHLDMYQAIGAALNPWEQVRFCYQWSHCNNFKLIDSGVRHPSIGYYQSLGRGLSGDLISNDQRPGSRMLRNI